MKILKLDIYGFRGIQEGHIFFSDNSSLFGANSSGKSTIIDAITIACSKSPIHKELSEFDFWGANPSPADRFRIIVTVGDFINNNPDDNLEWFRDGRAVTKWWDKTVKQISVEKKTDNDLLCCQIGFAGRFDYSDLSVETIRYFHDDDDLVDPFDEEKIVGFPSKLLDDIGLFVLPTLRLRENIISFNSYLFKRLLNKISKLPSDFIIKERDKFRSPENPIEQVEGLNDVINRIDNSFEELIPSAPKLKFRFTQTDVDSILKIISPHYSINEKLALPAKKHGSGLLSLQFLLLLLELGKIRKQNNESFILLIEEPEIHISSNIQSQLIYKAFKNSDQVICSTHSSQIASYFPYTEIIILNNNKGNLEAKPFRANKLDSTATNGQRKIFTDNKELFIKSLLYPNIIIPEGRTDYEWLTKLIEISESNEAYKLNESTNNSFGSILGIVPTHESSLIKTFNELKGFSKNIIFLVDGDEQGNTYISSIKSEITQSMIILQWGNSWTIEDVILYILKAEETNVSKQIKDLIDNDITDFEDFSSKLKNKYKKDYLTHLEIASIIINNNECLKKAIDLLNDLHKALLSTLEGSYLNLDKRSTDNCKIIVWDF